MPSTRMGLGIVIPDFGGVYDPAVEYEFYVWVRDGYNVFISRKTVPPGTPTTNEEYWFKALDFDDIADLSDVVTKAEFAAHTSDAVMHVSQADRDRWDGATAPTINVEELVSLSEESPNPEKTLFWYPKL